MEYFTLIQQDDRFQLNGNVNLLLENQPTHVTYHVECDSGWTTRRVEVKQRRSDGETHLLLTVDNALNWYKEGTLLPWAAGLTDIDLSITPSTNLLPIRKNRLEVGESCEVNCVWVQLPALTLSTLPQHYTRIDSQHFDYTAPSLNYNARLSVDEDGIIIKYGDLWSQAGIS